MTTTQYPCFATVFLTFFKNNFSLNAISGNKIICGGCCLDSLARADEAAIHPACLPITSNIKTFVDVAHMDLTSSPASKVEIAVYFATEPKPGEQSVRGRSLSTVFGIPIHLISKPFLTQYSV